MPTDRFAADDLAYLVGEDLWGMSSRRGDAKNDGAGEDEDMHRVVAAAVAATFTGCSWLFIQKLPSDYDGNEPPRCTTSKAAVYIDGVISVIDSVSVALMLKVSGETGEDLSGPIVSTGLEALIHLVSSMTGESWVDECRKAHADYRKTFELRAREPARPMGTGFYCTASPDDVTAGACNLTREQCDASRAHLVESGRNMSPCITAATVLCFTVEQNGKRIRGCAPTALTCWQQWKWAVDRYKGAAFSECVGDDERPPVRAVEFCAVGSGVTAQNPTQNPPCRPTREECEAQPGAVKCEPR